MVWDIPYVKQVPWKQYRKSDYPGFSHCEGSTLQNNLYDSPSKSQKDHRTEDKYDPHYLN